MCDFSDEKTDVSFSGMQLYYNVADLYYEMGTETDKASVLLFAWPVWARACGGKITNQCMEAVEQGERDCCGMCCILRWKRFREALERRVVFADGARRIIFGAGGIGLDHESTEWKVLDDPREI